MDSFGAGHGWAHPVLAGVFGVLSLLLIGGVIALVVWLVTRTVRRSAGDASAASMPALRPRDVLDHRLARGEVDIPTYRALVDELGRGGPSPGAGDSTVAAT
jgi:uncharacterized membrane protein